MFFFHRNRSIDVSVGVSQPPLRRGKRVAKSTKGVCNILCVVVCIPTFPTHFLALLAAFHRLRVRYGSLLSSLRRPLFVAVIPPCFRGISRRRRLRERPRSRSQPSVRAQLGKRTEYGHELAGIHGWILLMGTTSYVSHAWFVLCYPASSPE